MTKPLNAGPDVITGPPVAISASEPIQAVAPETAGTEMNGTPGGNGSTANGTSALGAIRSEEAFLAEIKAQSAHNDSSVDSLPVSSATITPPPNSVPSVIGGSMANGSVNGDGRASLAALVTGLGPSEVTDADVIVDVDAEVDDDGQRRGMFRRRA